MYRATTIAFPSRLRPTSTTTARLLQSTRTTAHANGTCRSVSSSAPATIADAGFWKSLVPKFMRRDGSRGKTSRKMKTKEWNPATYFIVMFLLIGSMSIQMIALKHSFDRYMRQSNIRIGLLREVVERIQKGEEVDVEQALGVGDAKKEADWEEMLRAIEQDEAMSKASKKQKKAQPEKSMPDQISDKTVTTLPTPDSESRPAPSRKAAGFGNFY